jgi:hypothetical protein
VDGQLLALRVAQAHFDVGCALAPDMWCGRHSSASVLVSRNSGYIIQLAEGPEFRHFLVDNNSVRKEMRKKVGYACGGARIACHDYPS